MSTNGGRVLVKAERLDDPARFLQRAGPLLETSEARHNLIYGLAGTLVSDPDVYPDYALWIVEEGGAPVAAAVRTPPRHIVIADAHDSAALSVLAELIAETEAHAPGAIGNVPWVDGFAAAWAAVTGCGVERIMAQGVFALQRLLPVPTVPGLARTARAADRDLAIEWIKAFGEEAVPNDPSDRQQLVEFVDRFIGGTGATGLWLWEVGGRPVSLSGHGGATPNGIRIGPVYTPPALRGNGYATALVAAQSGWLLDSGRRFCFLYTDLSNPTSNAIYQRIGYEQVAEAAMITFTDGRPSSDETEQRGA